jgi:hypothetical protein
MAVEQGSKQLTPQQELAVNTTKLVYAKAQDNKDSQAEAVMAIADILSKNPTLIDEFAEAQKTKPSDYHI